MFNQHITHSTTSTEFTQHALKIIHQIINSTSEPIHIALSGGTTPLPLYTALTTEPIDWQRIHLWWSDERAVPLDHPDSNFYQAKTQLLDHIQIPPQNIHPVPNPEDATTAASIYQSTTQTMLGVSPSFDLIILGIGPDGHTASLFPNTPAGTNQLDSLIAPIFNSPKPPPTRITFTFNLINYAKNILVMVRGKERTSMISEWLTNPDLSAHKSLPFTKIQGCDNTYWLMYSV